jgi:hypothetical protein
MAKEQKGDSGVEVSAAASIKVIAPEKLLLIEILLGDTWTPVTFGKENMRLTAPDMMAARKLMNQVKQIHEHHKRLCPQLRARPLDLNETKAVRDHLTKHGQEDGGAHGSDIRNRSVPKPGETFDGTKKDARKS